MCPYFYRNLVVVRVGRETLRTNNKMQVGGAAAV